MKNWRFVLCTEVSIEGLTFFILQVLCSDQSHNPLPVLLRFSKQMFYFPAYSVCPAHHRVPQLDEMWSQQIYYFQLQKFYGKYCECDDFSCKLKDDELCAGHGSCKCGKCQCDAGWTGEVCDCLLSTKSCTASEGSEVCSGHGHCICGTCHCDTLHTGQYCEEQSRPVSLINFIATY